MVRATCLLVTCGRVGSECVCVCVCAHTRREGQEENSGFVQCDKITTWCLENSHTAKLSDLYWLISQHGDSISLMASLLLVASTPMFVRQELLWCWQVCAVLMLGLMKAVQHTEKQPQWDWCGSSGPTAVQVRPVAVSWWHMRCQSAVVWLWVCGRLILSCLSCAQFTLGTGGIMTLCYMYPSLTFESQPWGWSHLHLCASDLREVFQCLAMPPVFSGPWYVPAGRNLSTSAQTRPGHVFTLGRTPTRSWRHLLDHHASSLGKSLPWQESNEPAC